LRKYCRAYEQNKRWVLQGVVVCLVHFHILCIGWLGVGGWMGGRMSGGWGRGLSGGRQGSQIAERHSFLRCCYCLCRIYCAPTHKLSSQSRGNAAFAKQRFLCTTAATTSAAAAAAAACVSCPRAFAYTPTSQGREDAAFAEERFTALLQDLSAPPISPSSSWPLVKPQVRVRMCGCQCAGVDEVRLVKPQVSQDV